MSAALNVFGNIREFDTDSDVFGNVFKWDAPSSVPSVLCMCASQLYRPGADASQIYRPGAVAMGLYRPGADAMNRECC